MSTLLTLLSGLALIALLLVLLVALIKVQDGLAGVSASLAKIAMGVRAIEVETGILKTEAPKTLAGVTAIAEGGEAIAGGLQSIDARAAALATSLGARGR
ncbi:MAG: hypothetical protein U0821_11665 [Chloroflexota bacterium]